MKYLILFEVYIKDIKTLIKENNLYKYFIIFISKLIIEIHV